MASDSVIHVGRLAPTRQWDQTLLDRLFDNTLYPTGLQFKRSEGYPNAHGCILIIPGRYWFEHTAQISEALATYDWVLAMRTSDEEDLFDIQKIRHPNIRWWVQTPRVDRTYGVFTRLFGVGFPPHFNNLPADAPVKDLDVVLSAQCTHPRREEAFQSLERVQTNSLIQPTEGFTKGLAPAAYVDAMMRAKIAPAPSGPASPDTFRLFEALEVHAVPIADDISPGHGSSGYWRRLFPDAPFPIFENYEDLVPLIEDQLLDWPRSANHVAAWWIRQKRTYAHWLREDLKQLGAIQ